MKVTQPSKGAAPTGFLPLELLVDHPSLHNRPIDEEWVQELKTSIAKNGLDTPLFVWNGGTECPKMTVNDKDFPASFVTAGFHRRAALRKLRKENPDRFAELFPKGVPVIVRGGSMQETICLQLRENVDRLNPTAAEILPQMLRLRDEFKMKNKEIAQRIGRSDSYVSQVFAVEEELGTEGVEEVVSGGVSAKEAVKAAAEVRKARKAGKPVDKKAVVAKAKEKTAKLKAKGAQREEKRMSLKRIWKAYKALPAMTLGKKLNLIEAAVEYAVGDSDRLPKEFVSAEKAAAKAEDDDKE